MNAVMRIGILVWFCFFTFQALGNTTALWSLSTAPQNNQSLSNKDAHFVQSDSKISQNINNATDVYLSIPKVRRLAPGAVVSLPVSIDESLQAEIEEAVNHPDGSVTLKGKIASSDSALVITSSETAVFVTAAAENKTYVLIYKDGRGKLTTNKDLMNKVVLSRNDVNLKPLSAIQENTLPDWGDEYRSADYRRLQHDTDDGEIAVIRLLLYYTEDTKTLYEEDVETRIRHIVEVNNQIYADSGVFIRLEIADIVEVDYSSRWDMGDALTDLSRDYSTSSAFDHVENERHEVGADAVVLFQAQRGFYCGIANASRRVIQYENMFNVTGIDCPDYVLGHELGHNFGLSHSRRQDDVGYIHNFGLGHGVDSDFATVMAYPSEFGWADKIAKYSSPELTCNDHPCGVSHESHFASADAVLALNLVRHEVAQLSEDTPDLTKVEDVLDSIQDTEFFQCVDNKIDVERYVQTITDIFCWEELSSLEGISAFPYLRELSVSLAENADISALASVKKLQYLYLSQGSIKDTQPLSNLPGLSSLGIYNMEFPEPSFLSDLGELQELSLSSIENVSSEHLGTLKKLKHINLNSIEFEDYSFLNNLSELEVAIIGNTNLTDISGLSAATGLLSLYLYSNQIEKLPENFNLPRLKNLSLWSNPLTDISSIGNLQSLIELSLSGTQIEDFQPLENLTNLDKLDVADAEINDLADFPTMPNVAFLDLSYNQISNLDDISRFAEAGNINLSHNPIDNIAGIRGLNDLTKIDLSFTAGIRDFSAFSEMDSVRWITLDNANIDSITTLPKLSFLSTLELRNNNITDLTHLYHQFYIYRLDISGNPVTKLSPLIGLSNLTRFAFDTTTPGFPCADLGSPARYEDLLDCIAQSDHDDDGIINSEDPDDDNDGISDELEHDYDRDGQTNEFDLDDDGDGVSDYVDYDMVLNPYFSGDAELDFDGDGLTNLEESHLGTLPFFADSDGDGILDPDDSSPLPILITDVIAAFADEAFASCYDKPYSFAPVGVSFAVAITDINCYDMEITDINGVERFPKLQGLYLNFNEIKDISPLQHTTGLVQLELSGNPIADLTPISYLEELEWLKLSSADVNDIAPLSHNTNLTNLEIIATHLRDISPLSGLTELEFLDLSVNDIRDISPLSELYSLRKLDLASNKVEDLDPLEDLISLENLDLGNNPVADSTALGGLTNLTTLDLFTVQSVEPEIIGKLTQLKDLSLGLTNIRDIDFLEGFEQLERLSLWGLGLTNIDSLTGNTTLKRLSLSDNDIVDLRPLKNNTALESVSLWNNLQITCVDIQWFHNYDSLFPCFSTSDNDEDGIPDPQDPDDDNDGIPDQYEIANGMDPLDGGDAELDFDGDGVSNLEEYFMGTDPNDASSLRDTVKVEYDFEKQSKPFTRQMLNYGWILDQSESVSGEFSLSADSEESSWVQFSDESNIAGFSMKLKVNTAKNVQTVTVSAEGHEAHRQSSATEGWIDVFYFGEVAFNYFYINYFGFEEEPQERQVWVDDLVIYYEADTYIADDEKASEPKRLDFDGDGRADVAVRRPSNGLQYVKNSKDGQTQRIDFGEESDAIPLTGHFDQDAIADIVMHRTGDLYWYIRKSETGEIDTIEFATEPGDIPVLADYDGDGMTDLAFRRPSEFSWYIRESDKVDPISGDSETVYPFEFGKHQDDIPVVADYDGDGKADVAVRRPSNQTWYIRNSSRFDLISYNSDGISRHRFGGRRDDIPVPADYDGDSRADLAVRRPWNSMWYISNSSGSNYNSSRGDGIQRVMFGRDVNDVPIVADYDGDGIADIAVRRASNSMQYILSSRDEEIRRVQFGLQELDIPLGAPIKTIIEMSQPQ